MATSAARVEANRRNALKSTGPKTPEGKDRSRGNSLKHGLTAQVLRTAEEVEKLGEPVEVPRCRRGSFPLDPAWIRDEIRVLLFRIERAGQMEQKLRETLEFRAAKYWEMDRRSEVEAIGSKIRRSPAQVASGLEKTPQGCLWMIERWAMLARAADRDGQWSEMARELAFDLLGTPHELRSGLVSEQIDTLGQVVDPGQDLAGFARLHVVRLVEQRKTLAKADQHERALAGQGPLHELGDAGKRLARYEAELRRRLRYYHELLERIAGLEAAPESLPPAPEPVVEADHPPEVIPPEAPVPILRDRVTTRKDRRVERVEQRRLAAERKLIRRLG